MLEKFLMISAVVTLIGGGGAAAWHYKEIHLPSYEQLRNQMDHTQCIHECRETCRANGIPIDRCKCKHCDVFRNS